MSDEHKNGDKYPIKKLKPKTTNSAKKSKALKATTSEVPKLKKKSQKTITYFQLIELKKNHKPELVFN